MTSPESSTSPSIGERSSADEMLIRRHLIVGWWSLAVFSIVGVALEVLHGFKLDLYLNVTQETRRLMWTLAHAHGTLLSLVHIAFAVTLKLMIARTEKWCRLVSGLLITGGILLPVGFFLGGLTTYNSDPGLGILLVPIGALCIVTAFTITAVRVSRGR